MYICVCLIQKNHLVNSITLQRFPFYNDQFASIEEYTVRSE